MKIYNYGNPDASFVLIQPVDDHDISLLENEIDEIKKLTGKDFYFMAFKQENWNKDLSPWSAPAVFGNEDFGEGANNTLNDILKLCVDMNKTYFLGGYSLAGLFALWASFQTDVFTGIAAASPSVWFPGFIEYMKNHKTNAKSVYLSLGDREEKTKNAVMATVGKCIYEANEILINQGSDVIFEWNSGNHFKDSDIRTAKAFADLLNRS
ncbi:MAG: esterase [Lachnospiraceae bacterium]|nr:esterase [Lachnospiraceae bacterium]MDY2957123.1 esterase [Lachnospiraceae bacterium]